MKQQQDPDWQAIYKRLTLYAHQRLAYFRIVDVELAQDLAAEAIKRHFDDDYAQWDPQKETLLQFLGSLLNGLLSNWMRKRSHVLLERDSTGKHDGVEPALPADEQLHRQRLLNQIVDELREHIQGDETMEAMLTLWLDGVDRPTDIAQRLNTSVEEIYNANRRFKQVYGVIRDNHERKTRNAHYHYPSVQG